MKREDVEIRDQAHLMIAEGTQDERPKWLEIRAFIKAEGFRAKNIEIWFDDAPKVWHWGCDISKLQEEI